MIKSYKPALYLLIFTTCIFANWEVVYEFPQGLTLLDISCTSPTNVWAVGLNEMTNTNQIYYSNNGGESWDLQYSGMDLSVFLLGIDMANSNHGYIAGTYMVFFPDAEGCGARTENGGNNWEPIPSPDGFLSNFRSVNSISDDETHLVGAWGFENTIGIYSTYDGGDSWSTFPIPVTHGVQFLDKVGSQDIWVTGGAWPEEDLISTSNPENNLPPSITYIIDTPTEIINDRDVHFEASIWHSSDGGNTWAEQLFNENIGYMAGIDMIDENTGIAVGAGENFTSQIYRTNNGGGNWNQISFPSQNEHILVEVQMVTSTDGWAVGYGPNGPGGQPGTAILKTNDGGLSWSLLDINEPIGLLGLSMYDEHIGYTCGGNNLKIARVMKYDDGFYSGDNCGMVGDVNDDSDVNVLDVVLTVNCILGAECNDCSDINSDEVVNVQDIVLIVNIIIGR